MKIFSLTQNAFDLEVFEIEVSLMPGLPQISILGQADILVKESIPKIRSAIKAQGFQLPRAQQILVDLKPQHFKKNNQGLELAIATAILQETGQIKLVRTSKDRWLILGHIGLKGDVLRFSDDLSEFQDLSKYEILTGPNSNLKCDHFEVANLKDLKTPKKIASSQVENLNHNNRKLPSLMFSKSAARLIQILAVGEHPCLLAGAVGSGKSTVIATAAKMLKAPDEAEQGEINKIQKYFGKQTQLNLNLRPEVNVHHSISTIAFLGGGSRLHPGEITRAHKGTLIMDEFMEFHSEIQDALREPLENAKLTIARNGNFLEFPADVFLLASTNLCKCGDFSMNSQKACRCTQAKLKSYLTKLNGPCLDRFHILAFSSCWENQGKEIKIDSIYKEVEKCIHFRIENRKQEIPNSKLSIENLNHKMDSSMIDDYFKIDYLSERRKLSLKRVARSIADLDQSERIRLQHMNEALSLTVAPFQWLEKAQRACAAI